HGHAVGGAGVRALQIELRGLWFASISVGTEVDLEIEGALRVRRLRGIVRAALRPPEHNGERVREAHAEAAAVLRKRRVSELTRAGPHRLDRKLSRSLRPARGDASEVQALGDAQAAALPRNAIADQAHAVGRDRL